MTSIAYDRIFEHFFGLIEDNRLINISKDDRTEILTELLHKSLYASYIRHLFSFVSADDPVQTLSFEMKNSQNEETDSNFVMIALAKWMKYEWLSPQLNSVVNTAQFFGGKEQKFYSQANHITELRQMTELAKKEARDFVRDRGYILNTYLSKGGLS